MTSYEETLRTVGEAAVLSSDSDEIAHLERQRDLLMKKETELHHMVQAVDELLEDAMSNKKLTVEEVAEILGDAQFPVYQAEAEQKWGDTDDWKISAQTTANMTRADWGAATQKANQVETALVEAMRRGVQPGSVEANELAESHRELISHFFPVSISKQVLIACGYVSDPRFTAYYEARGEGLATWLKSIIDANALANGIDPATATWE